MKAMVYRRYGNPAEVLAFREVPRPDPGQDEVLVRVAASSVNPADWFTVTGRPYLIRAALGLPRPRKPIPGRDVAGTVEAVGGRVTRFRPGDRVYGELTGGGAYAEFALAPERQLALMPSNLDFAAAAAVPLAACTALQCLRDGSGVRPGHRVLINGASGGIGTFGIQIARSLGAEVIAVCRTRNIEMVRSLGAAEVIDYTRDDFTRSGRAYDVILDLIGNHPPTACQRALRPGGIYLASTARPGGPVLGPIPFLIRVSLAGARPDRSRAKGFTSRSTADDFATLTRLIEAGAVKPVIDRTYEFAQTIEALNYQGQGHAQGKTVITM